MGTWAEPGLLPLTSSFHKGRGSYLCLGLHASHTHGPQSHLGRCGYSLTSLIKIPGLPSDFRAKWGYKNMTLNPKAVKTTSLRAGTIITPFHR